MTLRIMKLNMLKIRRIPKRRNIPIQPTHPAMNSREAGADVTEITLEMLDVDGVEADDGREEADIRLGNGVAEEEGRGG